MLRKWELKRKWFLFVHENENENDGSKANSKIELVQKYCIKKWPKTKMKLWTKWFRSLVTVIKRRFDWTRPAVRRSEASRLTNWQVKDLPQLNLGYKFCYKYDKLVIKVCRLLPSPGSARMEICIHRLTIVTIVTYGCWCRRVRDWPIVRMHNSACYEVCLIIAANK